MNLRSQSTPGEGDPDVLQFPFQTNEQRISAVATIHLIGLTGAQYISLSLHPRPLEFQETYNCLQISLELNRKMSIQAALDAEAQDDLLRI